MQNVLIRNLSQEAIDAIDARAAAEELSRNEYLLRMLDPDAHPLERRRVTEADWARFAELAVDLNDPEIMDAAWR